METCIGDQIFQNCLLEQKKIEIEILIPPQKRYQHDHVSNSPILVSSHTLVVEMVSRLISCIFKNTPQARRMRPLSTPNFGKLAKFSGIVPLQMKTGGLQPATIVSTFGGEELNAFKRHVAMGDIPPQLSSSSLLSGWGLEKERELIKMM